MSGGKLYFTADTLLNAAMAQTVLEGKNPGVTFKIETVEVPKAVKATPKEITPEDIATCNKF